MPIYKQTTEITNIDDLLSSVERDIEEVYFGDKNVFTVWDEYDGALPAQYSANGSALADYRIYGSAGGVGDKTVNLLNPNEMETGYYISSDNSKIKNSNWNLYYVSVTPLNTYTAINLSPNSSSAYIGICDESRNVIGHLFGVVSPAEKRIEVPENCYYLAVSVRVNATDPMLTEGSTAPAEYVPYGYEVPMSVKSVNLFDKDATDTSKGYIDNTAIIESGGTGQNNNFYISEYIRVSPNTNYTWTWTQSISSSTTISLALYDDNKAFIRVVPYEIYSVVSFLTSSNEVYVRVTVQKSSKDISMLNVGSTSLPYQPYYIITPIYIGSSPLSEDEYVDFGAQKIYRMSGGVLTPTDPPVPLPALPTCDGVTITDYAGQSAAPSRFYAKYRKQNF